MSIINLTLIQKLKRLKANITDVLTLDQVDAFTPTGDYHPSTKKYTDDRVAAVVLKTTPRTYISGDQIVLPTPAQGQPVGGYAMVWDDEFVGPFVEYTCTINAGVEVDFHPVDNLNGKWAVVTYVTQE